MTPSLANREDYEQFIYAIPSLYSQIEKSTLIFLPIGRYLVKITGELSFKDELRLRVLQMVDFGRGELLRYSYSVFRGQEKLYWYDPQPHPHIPSLAHNHPHHKHIPPDIKHNRVPAPALSFARPNLPFLLDEIKKVFLS